jgi:serine/threonine protein kinase
VSECFAAFVKGLCMPVPTTADDYLALVRRSGVVAPAALDALSQCLAAEPDPPAAPRQLANRMVRDGLLTVLQASLLLRGKWRNFVLCGKYKLLEHLGSGGMGQVFLCEHARMCRRVAIKILPPERAIDPACLRRFYREAQAVGALNHPNIVHAHDVDHDGRLHFLVMEYVDGTSLQDVVKKGGALPLPRACHYVRQAAVGLQHAHQAGLVHRDVKPSNLLLERSGLVKILDLGLARFFHEDDKLTGRFGPRNLIGTADYLAPEQALNSHAVDIRADLYSLGVTFYFLLTGRSPYREGTVAQKLLYHQVEMPEPVRTHRPEVPDGLAAVITRLLAKDPAGRYQTPIELAEALDPWTEIPIPPPPEGEMPRLSRAARRAEPVTATIPHSSRSTARVPRPQPAAPAPSALPVPRTARRNLWLWCAAAALLLAAAVCGGVVGWMSRPVPANTAGTASPTDGLGE